MTKTQNKILFFIVFTIFSLSVVATIFFGIEMFIAIPADKQITEEVTRNSQEKVPTVEDIERVLPKYGWSNKTFILFYAFCFIYWIMAGIFVERKNKGEWKLFIMTPFIVHLLFGFYIGIALSPLIFVGGANIGKLIDPKQS